MLETNRSCVGRPKHIGCERFNAWYPGYKGCNLVSYQSWWPFEGGLVAQVRWRFPQGVQAVQDWKPPCSQRRKEPCVRLILYCANIHLCVLFVIYTCMELVYMNQIMTRLNDMIPKSFDFIGFAVRNVIRLDSSLRTLKSVRIHSSTSISRCFNV